MVLASPVVFGNWKMNGLWSDNLSLASKLADRATGVGGTLGVFPPFTALQAIAHRVGSRALMVGGQDCHQADKGAFTGSVSAAMLKDAGAKAVLVGHSERRHGLGESSELVRKKAQTALREQLITTICIGETEEDYVSGQTLTVLEKQLMESMPANHNNGEILVAYEPVWAIGTGRVPDINEIADTHFALRSLLNSTLNYRANLLYGGSVKPENAQEIMSISEVDGLLVGGASLEFNSFWSIFAAAGGA